MMVSLRMLSRIANKIFDKTYIKDTKKKNEYGIVGLSIEHRWYLRLLVRWKLCYILPFFGALARSPSLPLKLVSRFIHSKHTIFRLLLSSSSFVSVAAVVVVAFVSLYALCCYLAFGRALNACFVDQQCFDNTFCTLHLVTVHLICPFPFRPPYAIDNCATCWHMEFPCKILLAFVLVSLFCWCGFNRNIPGFILIKPFVQSESMISIVPSDPTALLFALDQCFMCWPSFICGWSIITI